MAERIFKLDEAVSIEYQAPNKTSGQTVIAEIYLPGNVKDSSFPDLTLTERGSSGTYYGEFTPDQVGEWIVICHLDDESGQVIKRYSVGEHNVESVGQAVGAVDAAVGTVDGKATNIKTTVDNIDIQLDTVETKIDNIDTKVSALDTPPMIS